MLISISLLVLYVCIERRMALTADHGHTTVADHTPQHIDARIEVNGSRLLV